MAYAVTQACCNDASCVSVCPVNCIHPTPEERAFGSTDMLHIDPRTCIDCGACADACPVEAIKPLDQLRGPDAAYARINADWYATDEGAAEGAAQETWDPPRFPGPLPADVATLRVAVVGTGPSASYATQALLHAGARVTLLDRLPVPGGLLRYGVAPDHPGTKRIGERFAALLEHPRVETLLNVEVGRDVSHEELLGHHHAVLYAVGAAAERRLGVPGEELPGVVAARAFVAWYNAHPEAHPDARPDSGPVDVGLDGERAVVVGTGNVALDVARMLLSDPDRLASTDIADHALAALRRSRVREVVLLGRRGPEHAAYSRSELLELEAREDLEVVVADGPLAALAPATGPRLVLAFHSTLEAVEGDGRVERVRVARPGGEEVLETGLVLPAIGYRGTPLPGLPFDEASGTVPHDGGRVVTGTYVTGWIKRGPAGGIGANRRCAEETVAALLADAGARRLPAPPGTPRAFRRLLRGRGAEVLGRRQVSAIDRVERSLGVAQGRPRVKLATVPELLAAARRRA